ncbi:hypothetical protein [Zavarzinia compransoris]|uniref:Nitrite/Sulfite reductase ferredoxin-like domain-containing protein n=1 Tax=Zavarzinia compransoris TaxID=1264899 RepID=A0A317DZH7_9PROT|nr:hypothetical protein [Zavarzinia compransoris]PWR19614.1 hypothetical protein DKG75_14170 [Zavarzinia compransoris]TDP40401.1 precorrin-3B synthase [Zavarzinia compransoris]
MTAAAKGWCPSIGRPMAAADGLILRVKPPGGRLRGGDVLALAEAAAEGGNGLIDLTARGNLQFRGFGEGAATNFAALAVARGLALPEGLVEQRRNILVAPLAGDGARALAAALAGALADEDRFGALPAKFAFAIEDDRGLPLGPGHGDIACRLGGDIADLLLPGATARVAAGAALPAMLALVDRFLAVPGARRLRDLHPGVLTAGLAGVGPAPAPLAPPAPGPLAHGGWRGVAVGFPSGQGNVRQWRQLARLAGDGWLYPTPWRSVLVPGDADTMVPVLDRLGLVTAAGDPRLAVIACTGRPGCAAASVPTRPDAARLLDLLAPPLPAGGIHLSGCAKGCAHPGPAAVTLTGNAGHYDLVLGGRAGAPPIATGLDIDEAADLITTLLESRRA